MGEGVERLDSKKCSEARHCDEGTKNLGDKTKGAEIT